MKNKPVEQSGVWGGGGGSFPFNILLRLGVAIVVSRIYLIIFVKNAGLCKNRLGVKNEICSKYKMLVKRGRSVMILTIMRGDC